jgi:hypothetical protein
VSDPQAPVRRARHLLDPDNLQQSHRNSQSSTESLGRVQRWVMSVLAVTTILHLSAGLAVAAYFMDESRVGARIGLDVIAGVVGLLAVATGRLIHQKQPFSPWLVLGLAPGIVGLVLVLR